MKATPVINPQIMVSSAPPSVTRITTLPGPIQIPAAPICDEADFGIDDAPPSPAGNMFAALLPDAARGRTPAANDPSTTDSDAETPARGVDANARLRSVMAVRLVRARLLSGLSQGDVSKALGFKNQTQVALWERGRRLVTPADLVRIADVLGVNEGYLLGTSDEPERDQAAALRSACLRGVRKQLEQVAAITVDAVAHHARLVGPHAGHVRGVLAAGDDLLEAFGSFVRANSCAFENNMRGAATLQRRAHEFEATLAEARTAIRAHDALDADLRERLGRLPDGDIEIDGETLIGDED